ncbi:uncharacterized protein LOC121248076 [Juglans microcarpa x Juglans regia]|uniref:uncharacterized protein LOC121248076 n=1 Tax=Juglans microcarpa x Juglans regia TaxID=2249226 RepID=UPI001B7E32FB|nr:uncharacterized protein LOC121248076 [Juglans microcarpa x Juglans regia]
MELIPKPIQGSLKRCWRRQRYQRLHDSKTSRKNLKITRLGDRGARRRGWRIRAIPKLRWKIGSPLKLWSMLKNTYINMMVNLAGNVGYLNTANVFGAKRIPKGRRQGPSVYTVEEVENRLIFEIYKVLQASREVSTAT